MRQLHGTARTSCAKDALEGICQQTKTQRPTPGAGSSSGACREGAATDACREKGASTSTSSAAAAVRDSEGACRGGEAVSEWMNERHERCSPGRAKTRDDTHDLPDIVSQGRWNVREGRRDASARGDAVAVAAMRPAAARLAAATQLGR